MRPVRHGKGAPARGAVLDSYSPGLSVRHVTAADGGRAILLSTGVSGRLQNDCGPKRRRHEHDREDRLRTAGSAAKAAPLGAVVLALLVLSLGCRQSPPPPRVPVPTNDRRATLREREEMRPLPEPAYDDPSVAPPFDDVPLVSQRPPEQRAFVESYKGVGAPRITLFVNRTLEGKIVPVNPDDPLVSVERRQRSTGDVTVERSDTYRREYRRHDDVRDRTDRFESRGPGEYRESVDVYLRPGQYDEIQAKAIDYEAIENVMTDWIASNGQVTVISPTMARQRLSDEQVKEIEAGRPQALREVAQQLDADVLIQVQARPTRQTQQGLEARIVAEAINTRGGESIGRAVVDVPPPLDKLQINDYTRFLARKLMDDMAQTWRASPPEARDTRDASERGAAPTTSPSER
jgi:hypothetical protein